MDQDHENQRTGMNKLFENEKNTLVEEYEKRLRDLEAKMRSEFEQMQENLTAQIKELKDLLEKERANLQGNAQQMREQLQAEIDELKQKLQERTG